MIRWNFNKGLTLCINDLTKKEIKGKILIDTKGIPKNKVCYNNYEKLRYTDMEKFKLEKDNNSKKLIIGISILFCAVILIVGGTFAFLTQSDSKELGNIVTTDIDGTLLYNDENLIKVVKTLQVCAPFIDK